MAIPLLVSGTLEKIIGASISYVLGIQGGFDAFYSKREVILKGFALLKG